MRTELVNARERFAAAASVVEAFTVARDRRKVDADAALDALAHATADTSDWVRKVAALNAAEMQLDAAHHTYYQAHQALNKLRGVKC